MQTPQLVATAAGRAAPAVDGEGRPDVFTQVGAWIASISPSATVDNSPANTPPVSDQNRWAQQAPAPSSSVVTPRLEQLPIIEHTFTPRQERRTEEEQPSVPEAPGA